MSDGPNASGEYRRTAVGFVIPIDGSNHAVIEIHLRDSLGHTEWLKRIKRPRPSRRNGAEAASPRAGVAQDHERGFTGVPALADIWAPGLFANGMQALRAHKVAKVFETLATGHARS